MILEKMPPKWKGALSRWLVEVRPGTFLGHPSPRVRDELWQQITARPVPGFVLQLWSARTPQGWTFRQAGHSTRMLQDFEGLALVTIEKSTKKNRKVAARQRPKEE